MRLDILKNWPTFCLIRVSFTVAAVRLRVHRYQLFDPQGGKWTRWSAPGAGRRWILFGSAHFWTHSTVHRNTSSHHSVEGVVLVHGRRGTTCQMVHSTATQVINLTHFTYLAHMIIILILSNRIRAANEQFDTNQISPGTVFIQRFENALQAFVSTNIKTQHNWQDCEVYVSGSSVSGIHFKGGAGIYRRLCCISVCWRRIAENYQFHSIVETIGRLQSRQNPLHLQWRQWLPSTWYRDPRIIRVIRSRGTYDGSILS